MYGRICTNRGMPSANERDDRAGRDYSRSAGGALKQDSRVIASNCSR